MVGDNDGLQEIFTRIGTVEGEIDDVKSALDNMVQKLKRFSLKINNQSLADSIYRSGCDYLTTTISPID